ncbi:hypothetical protein EGW08_013266, partial [Elysia chlorotica]
HARQHASEKHIQCSIEGCASVFSNTTVYVRHLNHVHNKDIDLKEFNSNKTGQKEDRLVRGKKRNKVKDERLDDHISHKRSKKEATPKEANQSPKLTKEYWRAEVHASIPHLAA